MKKRYYFYLTLFIIWIAGSAESIPAETNQKLRDEETKLESVGREIKQQKKKIKAVKQKEARVLSKLNQIEKQLSKQNKDYEKLQNKINKMRQEIKNNDEKIKSLTNKSNAKLSYLEKRLKAYYKYQRRGGMRILLSSTSYNDFLKHEKFLKDIISQDWELFQTCLDTLHIAQTTQDALHRKKEELLNTKKAYATKQSAIKNTRAKKLALLKDVKKEKSLQINALKELEEYSKELQALIDRLQEKSPHRSMKNFSKMKGKLEFPVNGPIISSFGKKEHPELHTFTFQKGIEIKSNYEVEIKAIFEGEVIFADWFKGYGNIIIIDHGESYYTLSGHAAKLLKNVGDKVAAGEVIGLVGDTGSIKGNCLYFEVRHHGKPQDPLQWLKRKGNKN
jgi:septal ring factor EnvC (AmiA/AmiB activator)